MAEAGDMRRISIPFAAGVGTAAIFVRLLPALGSPAFGTVSLLGISFLLILLHRKESRTWLFPILFFLTGLFCFQMSGDVPWGEGPLFSAAAKCCEAFRREIDAVPFADKECGALLRALLTGDRSHLSQSTVASFRSSGASHILALSGLHLGAIYLILHRLLSFLGNRPAAKGARAALTVIISAFYTIMTGASASTTRAFLFILFREISALTPGRRTQSGRILLGCLTLQLALTPGVIGSISFQMSYLAMCGIIFLYPRMKEWYPESEKKGAAHDPMRWIWNAAAMSISCQAFTAPLAWYRFHTFPKYFILTNLLSLPLTSAIMALSVLTVTLHAMGICPALLVQADELCIKLLLKTLEIISEI